MQLILRVRNHEKLPPWYGKAWYDYFRCQTVCLPVPLNLLAAWSRALWVWLTVGGASVDCNPRAAFFEGYHVGVENERRRQRTIRMGMRARRAKEAA